MSSGWAWGFAIITLIVTSIDLTLTVMSWRESRKARKEE